VALEHLNLGRYKPDDVVRHKRTGELLIVLGDRHRSECINLLNPLTKEELIYHPMYLIPCEEEMVVLAVLSMLGEEEDDR